jgi:transposase InsO family protein
LLRHEPHHLVENRKRVQRVMREMSLVGRRKRTRQATTNSRHSYRRYPNLVAGLEVSYPDEVLVSDIAYVSLRNEFICISEYLIVDVIGCYLMHSPFAVAHKNIT